MATGTTSGTGALTAVGPSRTFNLFLDFGGGSVDIEVQGGPGSKTWIKETTAITADYFRVWEAAAPVMIRFNVTSHTTPITWEITPGTKG